MGYSQQTKVTANQIIVIAILLSFVYLSKGKVKGSREKSHLDPRSFRDFALKSSLLAIIIKTFPNP